jgi:hypothetical protein
MWASPESGGGSGAFEQPAARAAMSAGAAINVARLALMDWGRIEAQRERSVNNKFHPLQPGRLY